MESLEGKNQSQEKRKTNEFQKKKSKKEQTPQKSQTSASASLLFSYRSSLLFFCFSSASRLILCSTSQLILLHSSPFSYSPSFVSLVKAKETYIKHGQLLHTQMKSIWLPPNYPPAFHNTLLALLERFGKERYIRMMTSS